MFDLEREVTAWSETVHAGRCGSASTVAELKDHLYCEIERGRAHGLSDELAFAAAVAKLGASTTLASEHAKNRSILKTVCVAAARDERRYSNGRHRNLLMAHAILWAAVILATSIMMSKSKTPDSLSLLLIIILGPCWFASEQILRRALRQGPGDRPR